MMSTSHAAEPLTAELTPADFLRRLGESGDGPHDVVTAALMLSALDRPDKKIAPFRAHLGQLVEAVRDEAHFARDADTAARALSSVIALRYGYEGERENYDDPQNADIMSVIDRRRGLPVALGILYIHAARACGMDACGLLSPGHFLLRIGVRGSETLIDPFNGGAIVEREPVGAPGFAAQFAHDDLGHLPDPLSPVSDGDVLLRLQNNIKTRALKIREATRAIEILKRMTLIAPKRNILWLELAHLQESLGSLSAARAAYENCLTLSRAGEDVSNEAAFALHALKRRLN